MIKIGYLKCILGIEPQCYKQSSNRIFEIWFKYGLFKSLNADYRTLNTLR